MNATTAAALDFETLVLPSGGAKGVALMGALKVMEGIYGAPLRGSMRSLRNVVGVSVGALIGLYVALGSTVEDLKKVLAKTDTLSRLLRTDVMRLLEGNVGLNDGQSTVAFLRAEIGTRTGGNPDLTMMDLFRTTGVSLICLRVRVQSATLEFVGPWSTERVCDVVFDSMRVPLVYDPAWRNGEAVVDGGLLCPFPFAYLELLGLNPHRSLGLCFEPATDATLLPADAVSSPSVDPNFVEYGATLLYAATRLLDIFQRKAIDPWLWRWNIVQIPVGGENHGMVDLNLTPERTHHLYRIGATQAREFFARRLLAHGLVEMAGALENTLSMPTPAATLLEDVARYPTTTPKLKMD